jgi:hypothetical protein
MLKLLLKNRLNIILPDFTRDAPRSRVGRIIGTTIGAVVFSLILYYSIKLVSLIYNRLDLELADLILDLSLDYVFAAIFIIIILTGIVSGILFAGSYYSWSSLISFPYVPI